MRKKVTVTKKAKNTDVRNYDLYKSKQENVKESRVIERRKEQYLHEPEIEVF